MALNLYIIGNSTAFLILLVAVFCLIIISPVDAIYQCYRTRRLINIFFIAGAYIITFLLALLIYASRILTNRSVLASIPKPWIPVEKEDVGKTVRRLVTEGLETSAIIAYQAKPRNISDEEEEEFADYKALLVDRERPPWGHVEHPGWSSPSSHDLPDLPYRTVIQELPHLIEAKAVSLAPPDPLLPHRFGQPVPDTRVVEVLQRSASMGLRGYIQCLMSLDLISPPELGEEFLSTYELARFSSRELYEAEFRHLMHVFAEILRGMKSLSPEMIEDIRGSSRADSESIIGPSDEEGETDTVDYSESSPTRGRSYSLRRSTTSMDNTWPGNRSVRTVPSAHSLRMQFSSHDHGHARRPNVPRTPSIQSLRRVRTNVSASSGGSVIRLVDTHGPSDLPYVIDVDGRSIRSNRS
ncbi:hypothetical protein MPDQ_003382 [Monascus purpureus]|uniref:Defect at low temperature protein 1 n=1 Tax=Monascus purpureus TaxID=5098 RepID=A0A507QJ14_MONPU|nr:hypothetical protein MPDQ_003382 [Monascus purpureus]BDD58386.1 hypothetical protein MAP00_003666 [Monascus purpureus]